MAFEINTERLSLINEKILENEVYKSLDLALRNRHTDEGQNRLYSTKVVIAGAGGIGSNVAFALARAGVGFIRVIDFDKVEMHNIHRQQYMLKHIGMDKTKALVSQLREINPYIQLEAFVDKLDENNYEKYIKDADIIIEAFDNAQEKAKLVNYVLCNYPQKYLISNSGMAGYGESNLIRTRKVFGNFYICGDEKSDVNIEKTLFAARVSICAGHTANLAVRLIIDNS